MTARSGPGVVRQVRVAQTQQNAAPRPQTATPRTVTQPGLDEIVRLDPAVAAEVQQLLDEATAAGYDRGFAEGHTRATDRLESLSGSIAMAAQTIANLDDRSRREATSTLLDLAVAIATQVIDRTPHDGGEALIKRLRAELEALQNGPVTIEVNPEDVAVVASALPDEGIIVTANPALGPGEAHLRGEWAMADMTREAGWSTVRRILDDAIQH